MKNENTLRLLSFSKFYCATFGHKFKASKTITAHITEYKCAHCKEEVTINANGFLEKLTPKFRETNEFLAQVYQRRSRKILQQAS